MIIIMWWGDFIIGSSNRTLQKSSHARGVPLHRLVVVPTSSRSSHHKFEPPPVWATSSCSSHNQQHLAFKMFSGDCSWPLPCPLGSEQSFLCDAWMWTFTILCLKLPARFPKELQCTLEMIEIFSWRILQNSTFQASSSHLDAYSVQGCALHCLEVRPETRFAMVSSSLVCLGVDCCRCLTDLHPSSGCLGISSTAFAGWTALSRYQFGVPVWAHRSSLQTRYNRDWGASYQWGWRAANYSRL